ncbi:MAG: DUF4494 domain-containing protein [Muribaculaceae bacterium]|nr:DUF4494 domain-containing protein [Muribaculaceae bacterium]MCI6494411.1 DUF4494 domain-containing protein [Bacteroidales bacterium]MDY4649144.1 DUF4494 domain-containing protein [Muribaculaceae bacterium]
MAIWFECKVRYDKMQENGMVKKVNEPYLVDALTFTEAESRIVEEMKPYISGEYSISSEKKTKISEIFYHEGGDRYYLVKAAFISYDNKTDTEKKSISQILVQACDLEEALNNFNEGMKGTVDDYTIVSIAETAIMDIFKVNLDPNSQE